MTLPASRTPREWGLYLVESISSMRLTLLHLQTVLAEKNPDLAAADDDGMTALHWAVALGEMEMVSALLDAGADPAQRVGRNGADVMTLAALNRQYDVFGDLSRRGLPLDAVNDGGVSLVEQIIDIDDVRLLDIALTHRPMLFVAANAAGMAPLDLATSLMRVKTRSYLEKYAAGIVCELPASNATTVVQRLKPKGRAP